MTPWLRTLAATGIVFALAACAPNEGSERSQWESNQKSTQTIATHYPQAAKVINERLMTAKTLWDKAVAETDKEKRAKAMSDANDALTDVTGGLTSLEGRIERIDRLKGDRRFKAMSAGVVMPAFHKAEHAVDHARGLLSQGPITTADELKAKTKEANSELISAVGALERLAKKGK
jgi:hypothetical protein